MPRFYVKKRKYSARHAFKHFKIYSSLPGFSHSFLFSFTAGQTRDWQVTSSGRIFLFYTYFDIPKVIRIRFAKSPYTVWRWIYHFCRLPADGRLFYKITRTFQSIPRRGLRKTAVGLVTRMPEHLHFLLHHGALLQNQFSKEKENSSFPTGYVNKFFCPNGAKNAAATHVLVRMFHIFWSVTFFDAAPIHFALGLGRNAGRLRGDAPCGVFPEKFGKGGTAAPIARANNSTTAPSNIKPISGRKKSNIFMNKSERRQERQRTLNAAPDS